MPLISQIKSSQKMFLLATCMAVLMGCNSTANQPDPDEAMVGADRSAQGCIASAGYAWCEKLARCVRPWEVAEREGFDNTQQAFEQFCTK
ncbi:hypothetical protein [Shewanella waksmanii]|uniref:hypothetical protein n=1 Tax=Shewanella waksmanii TaxID=213783 RepID=UPI00373584AB